jgi:mycofactocin precursor
MSIQPEEVVSVVRDVPQQAKVAQPEVAPVAPTNQADQANQNITSQQVQRKQAQSGAKPRIVTELIIEEMSIDGMCGVY